MREVQISTSTAPPLAKLIGSISLKGSAQGPDPYAWLPPLPYGDCGGWATATCAGHIGVGGRRMRGGDLVPNTSHLTNRHRRDNAWPPGSAQGPHPAFAAPPTPTIPHRLYALSEMYWALCRLSRYHSLPSDGLR